MARVVVEVAPTILDWLLAQDGIQNTNAETFETVLQWRHGEKKPTLSQIEKVSKKTHIPLGYFFLQTPPQENCALLEYRTVDSLHLQNPSRDLLETIDAMEDVQTWMRDYLVKEGVSPLTYVASVSDDIAPKVLAERISVKLGIERDWFKKVAENKAFSFFRTQLESIGILVMLNGIVGTNTRRALDIEEFRAFTLIDDYAPLIFINGNDSEGAKLFSLLHECTHIWIGQNSFFNDSGNSTSTASKTEKLCNAVAAEILAPEELFISDWYKAQSKFNENVPDILQRLAHIYKCSTVVIARRGLDHNFITKQEYYAAVDEAKSAYQEMLRAKKESHGGDFYKTQASRYDSRFLHALSSSTKEGKTLYTDAFRLTHTNRATFNELMRRMGARSEQ